MTFELAGKHEWSPIATIADMVKRMPELVSRLLGSKNNVCGTFHLGHSYNLELWENLPDCYMAACKEQYPHHKMSSPSRIILLSDTAYLLLQPKKGDLSQSLLVAWSFLHSLVRVQTIAKNVVVLTWMPKDDPNTFCEQVLEIEGDMKEFLEELLTRMARLKAAHSGSSPKKTMLREDEVSLKAATQVDINEINENIAIYESSLESEPSISAFQTLMLLYQKVY